MFYKHKGYLCGIGVVIIERGLDVMNITTPDWLGPLLLVIGIGIIVWTAYMAWKERHQVTDQANLVVERPLAATSNILHIERQEPSNRPPFWLVLIGMIASIIFLAVGVFQTYLVLSGIIIAKFNFEWIAFYLLFGVFPIWLLIDLLIFDRKYYKSGRSATAIEVTFVVRGEITDVFNKCSNILETMNANIIRKNTPTLIKARFNKSNISVEVSPKDDNVQIYVVSDATWVTVKIGRGRNQRNIDEFQKHLIDEFRVYKPDTIEGIQPKSYDKRDVIIGKEEPIENEPEISIHIDKCSVSNYGQSDQAIEVALTLNVNSPPVNITDLQLYMGDEMLELLSPAMPITQRTNKECYMTKYKLSLRTIYEVDKDKKDKYRIYVVAMGQKFSSKVFSINNP